ncbi:hypothetical protein JCM39068_21010 [Desulfocastanea catecholica]
MTISHPLLQRLFLQIKSSQLFEVYTTFEIGGKGKDFKQINDVENSYVVADDIEVGFKNKLPLWLFGFMY